MRLRIFRRCTLLILVLLSGVSIRTSIAYAQDDGADIVKLAAELHREDVGDGLYTAWIGGDLGKRPDGLPKNIEVGQAMPSFSLKKFGTVQSVRSDGLTAPYLINLWASWCPPCKKEFPRLIRADQSGNLTFPILFVNTGDTKQLATPFLKQFHTKSLILFDPPPAYDFADQIGMRVYPSSVLIGEDGTVLAIHTGEVTETALKFLVEVAKNPGQGSYHPKGMIEPVKPFALDKSLPLLAGVEQYDTLNDDQPYVVYTFDGKKGSTITISMRAVVETQDDFADPYLVLLDSKGKVVAYDDDSGAFETDIRDKQGNDLAGNNVDALIKRFKLPSTGKYTLVAARAGYEAGMNQGRYQIILITDKSYF